MMMDFNKNRKQEMCDDFLRNIDAFREGWLDDDAWLKLESHRLECTACQAALVEEEKFSRLLSEVPDVNLSPDFRDNVLRKWRTKRDSVRDAIPAGLVRRLGIGLYAILALLLLLPIIRTQLLTSAYTLTNALDRLPPEFRDRIQFSFSLPTWAEIAAWFQVMQGRAFGMMGEVGSAIAPWSMWLWVVLIVSLIAGVVNFSTIRSRDRKRAVDQGK